VQTLRARGPFPSTQKAGNTMIRSYWYSALLLSVSLLPACGEEPLEADATDEVTDNELLFDRASPDCALSEALPPKQLGNSERGAFTSEGRFFAIGSRPKPQGDGLYWLVEVTKDGKGYTSRNVLTGTLEGTSDGTLSGAPKGDACGFSGMAVHGDVLYAGCFAIDGRAALVQVDTRSGTVRAGSFDSCSFDPAARPCKPISLYPNGMSVDSKGRVYLSNTQAFTLAVTDYSVAQVEVDGEQPVPGKLAFRFRSWLTKDLARDSFAPNGIQIRDDVLYYVGGANLNAVPILADGKPGPLKVLFQGPALSMIDDFALGDGELLLARAQPANVGRLRWPAAGKLREIGTCRMPLLGQASSLTYQPEIGGREPLFPAGSIVVTSFFGGGLYTLPGFR
jgi:hypothetical protein